MATETSVKRKKGESVESGETEGADVSPVLYGAVTVVVAGIVAIQVTVARESLPALLGLSAVSAALIGAFSMGLAKDHPKVAGGTLLPAVALMVIYIVGMLLSGSF